VKEKYKILDTNLFLSEPKALFSFKPKKEDELTYVILPLEVLAELDKFKKENSERGRNSRETLRMLHSLIKNSQKNLYEGIPISNNYIIKSSFKYMESYSKNKVVNNDNLSKTDSSLLNLTDYLAKKGFDVELVTNDVSLITIASAFKINANSWKGLEGKVDSLEKAYKGWRIINSKKIYEKYIDKGKGELSLDEVGIKNMYPNEYLILRANNLEEVLRYDKEKNVLVPLIKGNSLVEPRNSYQKMYMDALRNKNIDLVFALGVAGTSKTFLAMDAAIEQAIVPSSLHSKMPKKHLEDRLSYGRVFVTRPRTVSPDEFDVGYLPGDLKDKIEHWLGPIFDQLYELFDIYKFSEDQREYILSTDTTSIEKKRIYVFDSLFKRGRTIKDAFWIIDDAQNLTLRQIYDLGTRGGFNCKLVINGDPNQCDLRGESALISPLVRASEAFKEDETTAIIFFPDNSSERGKLTSKFIRYLNRS